MDMYLYKFTGCLFIFYLVYTILLEKQNNHHFKRFYLIGTLAGALSIPLITVNRYVERTPEIVTNPEELLSTESLNDLSITDNSVGFEVSDILWTIYLIGVFIFFVRFVVNLRNIYNDILKNKAIDVHPFTYILLEQKIIPHSFFKYIFLHKLSFDKKDIPKEVLLHEQTHAQQLHSLDIVLLELIQIMFWFHPLIYVIKQHIKLNHEFLADHAVLNQGVSPKTYQNILLHYSSSTNHHQLASAINYSSIKKRFTVMKTQTSKTRIWISTLLLIPLVGLLLVSFTTKNEILIDPPESSSSQQINTNPTFLEFIQEMEQKGASFYLDDEQISVQNAKSIAKNNKGKKTEMLTQKDENGAYVVKLYSVPNTKYARSIEVEVLDDNSYLIDGLSATKKTFVDIFNQLHQDISKETRNKLMNIHVLSSKKLPNEEVWFIYNALEDYGYHRIVTSNQEIIRSKGNTPFAIENHDYEPQKQEGATKAQIDEYNRLAKAYNSQPEGKRIVKAKDYKRMKYIYNLMTVEQRKAAHPLPKLPPPPPPPLHKGKVSEDLLKKYNYWIKGLKNSDGSYKIISSGESSYYSSIYENMTAEQKKRAVGVPPPPPPPKPKVIKVKDVPAPPPSPKSIEVKEVPPPPPPPKPSEYIKKMAKTNAKFFYEGKPISSKEAISIVNKNQGLYIKTKKSDTRTPEVYLTKAPIIKEIKRN